jgi:D-xylose 1-dehydrogenase (NADP+, D-xylono-1,5-lactone-forming)
VGIAWGLLSTAPINTAIIDAARRNGSAEIVAIGSRSETRAEDYAREHDVPRAHGSYDELIADDTVEAVYISLPNSMHYEWTTKALAAGKHVLVEKPFTRHAHEAVQAAEAADKAGLVLSEAFMWRHHPQVGTVRQMLDDGAIGRLVHIRATFGFNVYEERGSDDARVKPELDGGSLMDVGCYCVSGIRALAGREPIRVSGEQIVDGSGVDVRFAGLLRFDDNLMGQFDCGFVQSFHCGLEAVGETGSIVLRDPWHGKKPVVEVRRSDGVELIDVDQADPYERELVNVGAAIEGTAPLEVTPADSIGQARVLEALYAGAEDGAAVAV